MVIAMIAAGGSSKRMGTNKLKIKIGGTSVIEHTLMAFDCCEKVNSIVLVTDDKEIREMAKAVVNKPIYFAKAGEERQYSVRNGLEHIGDDDIVLIHDGARPFVSDELICRCVDSTIKYGSGVAAIPVYDSLKRADGNMNVINSIDRDGVYRMQTPQGFLGKIIKEAHKLNAFGTDDAYLVQQAGHDVKLVVGEERNIKLTTPEDIHKMNYRVGQGYDVHKLEKGRELVLCGVKIPYEYGLQGHSDADVAVHALMDAMLGAAGAYDIGRLFPDTDNSFKGISSMKLLDKVRTHIAELGFELVNCDITIIAQKPKLLPYIDDMRKNVSATLKADFGCVNVKATTTERLGFEGRGEGISAMAVVMVRGV